jgi:hypothetical protein
MVIEQQLNDVGREETIIIEADAKEVGGCLNNLNSDSGVNERLPSSTSVAPVQLAPVNPSVCLELNDTTYYGQ